MTYEFVSIIIIAVMAIYDTCYRSRDDEDDD
jgi:hypothetical protein